MKRLMPAPPRILRALQFDPRSENTEYALNRSISPALVAEYQTRLPDKMLLRAKLHEFYELAQQRSFALPPGQSKQGARQKPPARSRQERRY